MGTIGWICMCTLVGVLCYKCGKWYNELEMSRLQSDNTRLSGEVYRMRKQVIKAESLVFGPPPAGPIENITELEKIKWD